VRWPADREAATVADALVAADLDLALDVLRDLAAEVTLDLEVLVDESADLEYLVLGEVADLGRRVHTGPGDDLVGAGRPDAVDVGQRDIQPLVAGKVDACDPCHPVALLALPLLVPRVRADHEDVAAPADDATLVAHLLHRRSDLHRSLLLVPVHHTTPREVVRRELHQDPVSREIRM
jgi:hypothetical protein